MNRYKTKIDWPAAKADVTAKFEAVNEACAGFDIEHWHYQVAQRDKPPRIEMEFVRQSGDGRRRETFADTLGGLPDFWEANPPEDEMCEVAGFVAEIADEVELRAFRNWRVKPGKLAYQLKPDYRRGFIEPLDKLINL